MKFGELKIFANESSLERDVFEKVKENDFNFSNFKFQTGYKNSLLIDSGVDGYCKDCHYIFYVHAEKMTETTIFLGSESSKISLQRERTFFDEIIDESITLATFYNAGEG